LTNASEIGVHVEPDKLLGAMGRVDRIYYPRVYDFKGRMKEFWDPYDAELLDRLGVARSNRDLLNAVNFAFLDVKKWGDRIPIDTLRPFQAEAPGIRAWDRIEQY
jgi:hypothetical protein